MELHPEAEIRSCLPPSDYLPTACLNQSISLTKPPAPCPIAEKPFNHQIMCPPEGELSCGSRNVLIKKMKEYCVHACFQGSLNAPLPVAGTRGLHSHAGGRLSSRRRAGQGRPGKARAARCAVSCCRRRPAWRAPGSRSKVKSVSYPLLVHLPKLSEAPI